MSGLGGFLFLLGLDVLCGRLVLAGFGLAFGQLRPGGRTVLVWSLGQRECQVGGRLGDSVGARVCVLVWCWCGGGWQLCCCAAARCGVHFI